MSFSSAKAKIIDPKFLRKAPSILNRFLGKGEGRNIPLHNELAAQGMRNAGRVVGNTLGALKTFIEPGVTTADISHFCQKHIENQGAVASSLGYFGFPGAACTSVNDSLCHGVPSEKFVLNDGDLVKVDITCHLDGFYGDSCYTHIVGNASEEMENFVDIGRKTLLAGILQVKPGNTLFNVGKAIEEYAVENNTWVCKSYCGHGIGHMMHQDPQVLHFGASACDITLEEGMFFTIEPILGYGRRPSSECYTLKDDWTIMTTNKSWAVQFEHCIGVTADGFEIFTLPDESFDPVLHIRP